jgi:hypothetical protein
MRFLFFTVTILCLNQAFGQPSLPDSASIAQTIHRYHQYMGVQARIYNGVEFIGYDPSMKGHAYFISDTLDEASIRYEGIWYEKIPALYDIIADKLVISDVNGNLICPFGGKVQRFLLRGHDFIQTSKGYYDVLCTGAMTIHAKRTKEVEEFMSVQEYTRTATEKDHYYLVKGDVYYSLNNAKALLSRMGDKRRIVRQYLRKNKIKIRKSKELAIVKAAEYYNQLPH